MKTIRYFFCIAVTTLNVYSQVIIKDSVILNNGNKTNDFNSPLATTYAIHVSIVGSSVKTTNYHIYCNGIVVTECNALACAITGSVNKDFEFSSSSVNITYTDDMNPTNVPTVSLQRTNSLLPFFYTILFKYPFLNDPIYAGHVSVDFATQTINPFDPQYTYFSQGGNETWADSIYDHISTKIRKSGCALTCIAMILKAYGLQIDPGSLNYYLKTHKGYDRNGNVQWDKINPKDFAGNDKIVFQYRDETGIKFEQARQIDGKMKNPVDIVASVPKNLNSILPTVTNGSPVVAQVAYKNTATDGTFYYS